MQRLIRYCAGWVMATSLATGVSWVAIQNLVTTAALSQPAVPVSALSAARPTVPVTGPTAAVTTPAPSVTRRPARATRTPSAATSPNSPTPTGRASRPAGRPSATATTEATVQGYSLKGGQVVLELRPDSATLVSAIPAADYQTETWKTEYWIRVDFANGDQRSSVIVSWYNQEPVVQQTEF